jgi:hypothetical protein
MNRVYDQRPMGPRNSEHISGISIFLSLYSRSMSIDDPDNWILEGEGEKKEVENKVEKKEVEKKVEKYEK